MKIQRTVMGELTASCLIPFQRKLKWKTLILLLNTLHVIFPVWCTCSLHLKCFRGEWKRPAQSEMNLNRQIEPNHDVLTTLRGWLQLACLVSVAAVLDRRSPWWCAVHKLLSHMNFNLNFYLSRWLNKSLWHLFCNSDQGHN